jgi:tRNA A-37 threonylcarbamoyl transferase component Bud32
MSGLNTLHELNIIHGNLTPTNIFISEDQIYKICLHFIFIFFQLLIKHYVNFSFFR